MASLAEIRAKLKEQENRSSGTSSGGGDNSIYPFWNIKEGESAPSLMAMQITHFSGKNVWLSNFRLQE